MSVSSLLLSAWRTLRTDSIYVPVCLFGASRLAIFSLFYLYIGFFPLPPESKPTFQQGLGAWDAKGYLEVAERGYWAEPGLHTGNLYFFPLYPLAGRYLGQVLGSPFWAFFLLANGAFLAALILLYHLVAKDYDPATAQRACLYLCLFPTSFIFACLYQEPLFLALALASLVLARRQQWVWAAVTAGLAALTRNGMVGGACLVALMVEYLHQRGWRAMFSAHVWRLLPAPLLAGLFPLYLYAAFGNPLAFVTVTATNGAEFTGLFGSLHKMFTYIAASTPGSYNRSLAMVVLLYLLMLIAALVVSIRRVRPSYLVYATVILLLTTAISNTGPRIPLWSMLRYEIVIFPLFVILGAWGRYLWVHYLLVFTFALIFGLFPMFFFCNMWVS